MTIGCPGCGAKELPVRLVATDRNLRVSSEKFRYHGCRACGCILLDPVPGDLGRYYPQYYYAIPGSRAELARHAVVDLPKLRLLQRLLPAPARLLEIGPAYGFFAHLAKEAGYTIGTVEMDGRCCRFLREVVGVDAIQTADAAGALAAFNGLDAVALWHVLEHLADPWPTLAAAAAALRPGGLLILAAPNPQAFQFRVLGRYWVHVDAPRHVLLVPATVLQRRLAANGLETLLLTTDDEAARGWNTFGWEFSLAHLSPIQRPRPLLRLVGRALGRLLRRWDRQPGRGSAYTLVLRRTA